MGVIRNAINIEGISIEEDLPTVVNGQIIRYSEIETLFIPQDKPEVKSVYEIRINLDIKDYKSIQGPFGKIVIVDGIKSYQIIYTENKIDETACISHIQVPYNTFFELPREIDDIYEIKVFIIDAFFHLLEPKKIYGHFVYLLDIHYDSKKIRRCSVSNSITISNNEAEIGNLNDDVGSNYGSHCEISSSIEDNCQVLIDIDEEIM